MSIDVGNTTVPHIYTMYTQYYLYGDLFSMFKYIVLLSSLTIASVAAFFSISGLGSLFAGAFIPVVIMASALEAGKLITASFLTRHWSDLTSFLKTYYIVATSMLIVITSAGIYGFLTAAYQTTADQLSVIEQQVSVLDLKRNRYQEQLDLLITERSQVTDQINQLTEGLTNNQIQYVDPETGQLVTSTSRATREALQEQINIANGQRGNVDDRITSFSDSITSIDIQKLEIESGNEVIAEIGPLRYLSNLTGWSMDKVVNVFALMIIFVFDPLAVSLVVGYNRLVLMGKTIYDSKKQYEIYKEVEESKAMAVYERGAEKYKNAMATLAEKEHSEEEIVENDNMGVDKPEDDVLYLGEEKKPEIDPAERSPNHWGLGRSP